MTEHMSKYLVLYQSEAALGGMSVSEMFANSTPEQLASGMAAWQTWYTKAGAAVLDLGAPLGHSMIVSGGGAAPGKTAITGYSFLQAESMDEAVALMKEHPHFHMPDASVQILECLPTPGR
jgi:hypothetical protein